MAKFRILVASVFIVAIVGGIYSYMKNTDSNSRVLRVAFPSTKPVSSYEPTNIHWSDQYIFLENVYSPLFEFDNNGTLRAGIAEADKWVGSELQLSIRNNLKTENGTPITAADVVFSLKRLLVLSGNTHGDFKELVCGGAQLKSVEDNCPEITSKGNVVIIKTKKREPFLIPMLAALDFAIIPQSSVDPKTLKIVNYKETSGPYYVARDDGNGNVELKMNPYSYHAAKNIPQIVELVPEMTPKASLDALLHNQVDLVTTIDSARASDMLPFAEKHPQFRLHRTSDIRELFLLFTERGLKELSADERHYVATRVREAFLNIYKNNPAYSPVDTFFPILSDGALTANEQIKIDSLNARNGEKPDRKIEIGILHQGDRGLWIEQIQKYLPNANCAPITNIPAFEKHESISQLPDAFIATTDISFQEDINLISYSVNAGLFGLSKSERAIWLKKYMTTEDLKERLQMLSKLQYNALSSPVLVPLVASPYTALVRKPWRFELSTQYANDPLWKIKHD